MSSSFQRNVPITHPSIAKRPLTSHPIVRQYQQYTKLDVPDRIHIIGSGAIGKLVAYSLQGLQDPPPITLIYHRPQPYTEMLKSNKALTLLTSNGRFKDSRGGFEVELIREGRRRPEDSSQPRIPDPNKGIKHFAFDEQPIHNLIVSLKAYQVVGALANIVHRLSASSCILFLNSGMGVVEELNEQLFPNPDTRPNYLIGVNTHGVFSKGPTSALHQNSGTITIGLIPRVPYLEQAMHMKSPSFEEQTSWNDQDSNDPTRALSLRDQKSMTVYTTWPSSSRYLLRTMMRSPALAAVAVSPSDIFQTQLETLAVMSLIDPLTIMLDCRNGSLLHNNAISRTFFLLLAEITLIIRSLPELQGMPNVPLRFSPERLEGRAVSIIQRTSQHWSSSLRHARNGLPTEIEYLNGYIVRRGEELGIKPVMNYMMLQMVLGKQKMIKSEMSKQTPFAGPTILR